MLRAGVERTPIHPRRRNGIRPVPTLRHGRRRFTHHNARVRLHIARLPRATIETRERIGRAGKNDIGRAGLRRNVGALAAAYIVIPIAGPRAGRRERTARITRHTDSRVVLLCTADVIRHFVRRGHTIDLRSGVSLAGPCGAACHRYNRAAIVRFDHATRVARIDPEIVMIGVRRVYCPERLSAIRRLLDREVEDIHRVPVLRVGGESHEIEGALPEVAVRVHERPRRTGIIRPIQAAALSFDIRPHAAAVGATHRHCDFSEHAGWESGVVREFSPVVATVNRLEEPTPRPAAPEHPRATIHFPERRVENP